MKYNYNLIEKSYFKWYQVVKSISNSWKKTLMNNRGNCRNFLYPNHHSIKNNSILAFNKLTPAELYSLSIFVRNTIPTTQKYYKDTLPNVEVEWKDVYLLPRRVTIDTKLRMFQYKVFNNILYLNKHLFLFGKKDNKFCSYCLTEEETISHIFATCQKTSSL